MALLYLIEGHKAVDTDGGVWNLVDDRRWQLAEAPLRTAEGRLTVIAGGGVAEGRAERPPAVARAARAPG